MAEKKETAAETKKAAPKKAAAKVAAEEKAAKPAKTAKAAAKPAEKAAKAEKVAKTDKPAAKKSAKAAKPAAAEVKAPMMRNGKVVVESKAPLYKVKNQKGTAPYEISDQCVKVTLVKSTIGCLDKQQATVAALGLKKIGSSKVFKVSPALNGMLFKVKHLVKVEEVK